MDTSQFKPVFVYAIYIASTPEKVWEALTQAEFSKHYFHGMSVTVEPKVGGKFLVHLPDGTQHISGDVIEHDPPKRLTMTWNVNWPGLVEKLGTTLVTYAIEPAGKGNVRLTLTQSQDRPISDDILEGGRNGWPAIMSMLKSLLETGKVVPVETKPPERMLKALADLGIEVHMPKL
ncbi:MAG: ATPase [Proteobacteria bacterium SG_bin9]|nr:MAG: ATPase [Proteobacteria bacterium SG_bin9]